MAYVDWMIKVKRLVACNCDYGCPCEFNAPPTNGDCEGLEAFEVTEGYFDSVRLDGLRFGGVYRWPGPVHEGQGAYLPVIDDKATEEQQNALFKILSGEEQEPTTLFSIYGSTIETEFDPVFAPIEFEWDLEGRTGRAAVTNVFEADFAPVRNPITGAPHRALIKLPEGFEFREAEMASADFRCREPLPQEYKSRYGFLTYAAYGPYGVIEEQSYPLGRA
jgi:hypothetical protein